MPACARGHPAAPQALRTAGPGGATLERLSKRKTGASAPANVSRRQGRRLYGPRYRLPWIPIVGVAALALAAFLVVRQLEIGAPGERVLVSGVGDHVAEGTTIAYNSVPPAGGPHWPAPARWGAYSEPVPDERAVHNLEHGGVVISHNAIPAADLEALTSLLARYPRDRFGQVKLVIRPYPAIPEGTFVLAAWGWKQSFSAYDDAAVRAFLDAHLGRCCESVP